MTARTTKSEVGFELITSADDLLRMTVDLHGTPIIALDTEASSFHRYREQVCLIQISDRARTWLIDPLAVKDLSPLGRLLADPRMEVVIHDADYDLRMLAKHHGIRVEHVFDTLVAAELLNEPEIGLAALLLRYQGLKVDKKFQKADWSKRPLPMPMLQYAAGDTAHLIELRDTLRAALVAKKRWTWAQEEFGPLTNAPFELPENEEPGFLRLKGAKVLRPQQLAVLREVHAWRESVAEQMDRAPFMVVGNEALVGFAKDPPTGMAQLVARPGVGDRLVERHGKKILAAIERGRALPKEQWPRLEKAKRWDRDNDYEDRLKRLKAKRDELTKAHDLRSGIVASNQLLADIARTRPGDLEALAALPGIRQYQVEHFGNGLLSAL